MKVYVLSSVSFDCYGEFQDKTVWGVFESEEDAKKHIEDNNIKHNESYISIDEFLL